MYESEGVSEHVWDSTIEWECGQESGRSQEGQSVRESDQAMTPGGREEEKTAQGQ